MCPWSSPKSIKCWPVDTKGYIVTFDDDKCLIFDKENKQLIASIAMAQNRIFPLRMPTEQNAALSSIMEDTTL